MENDYLDNLKQLTINNEVRVVQHDGIVTYDEAITKGVLLPLRFQFRKFFEHGDNFKNMYEKTIALNQSNSNTISNFIQCDLWKNKISQNNQKLTFSFFMYIDNLEINNPRFPCYDYQSISAIYYNFPLNENNSLLSHIRQ